jgi:hypothetical protein
LALALLRKEKWMNDQSKMSPPTILKDLTDATSSLESAVGITPSISPDGPMTDKSGQAHALANLSPRQAKAAGLLTSGTYGLRGSTSSTSAALIQSLANKLRRETDLLGSTLFRLTWKVRFIDARRLIYRLRASARRTSGNDCFSWPTPQVMDTRNDTREASERTPEANKGGCSNLREIVQLLHWETTPSASDGEGRVMEIRPETSGKYKLRDWAHLASWGTPRTQNTRQTQRREDHNSNLEEMVLLVDSGTMLNGSIAPTVNTGHLNPAFSRWLMGLPEDWDAAAILAFLKR